MPVASHLRAMLAMLSRRFRVDRVRGVTVTQQTLLAVGLDGYSYNQMIAFKEKVEYILNGMPPESWPSDTTLFSWFYGKIKASRGMQRIVDKVKDSAPSSNMRSFSWLWEQFSDYLAELRENQNERDFREAMMKETARFDSKAAKEKAKQTTAATAKANAAPPCRRRNSLHRPRQQSRKVMEREMSKARVKVRVKERVKVKERQGQRPKVPLASQVRRARQRPKQPSHASFFQKELAIVEPPVLSVMRPPQQMQPRKVQVQPQRPLQRRQQQSHLSCLALHQQRRASPVVLVPQRVSSGLD